MNAYNRAVLDAARQLAGQAGSLPLPEKAHTVYNPLDYAWEPHAEYISRFADGPKRVLFLGMNPGPWGMAQTGIPFGEVAHVTDWLRISAPVSAPPSGHPKRPIRGYDCPRSEVSGRRLWALFAERFGSPEAFFAEHFVANYCPLVFMEASGRNLTPDKLERSFRRQLYAYCDQHLQTLIETLQPEYLIGVGKFAESRLNGLINDLPPEKVERRFRIASILHPSPANPRANRDWAGETTARLVELGVWQAGDPARRMSTRPGD
jgi:single-strand selective monofunctional uracil DNA glycosylase